jgi:hypothetical protein
MESWLKSFLFRWGFVLKRRPQVVLRKPTSSATLAPCDLMQAIHGKSIYEGFDFRRYRLDLAGWGGDSPAFAEMVAEVRPSLIVEVGSWKGASAISMADATEICGLKTKILCVDTWLGALEFRTNQDDPERFQALECLHGFPSVYYRFLANVCYKQHSDRIIPFPIDAASAALWLMMNGVRADLIYVDASHEEEAVYQDLLNYHSLLSPRGRIFGDDWDWASVRAAVSAYARYANLSVSHCHDKWVLARG